MGWFDVALSESHSGAVSPSAVSRALADKAVLHTWAVGTDGGDWAEQAVAMAREIGDPALLVRALTACAVMAASQGEAKQDYFDETMSLARSLGDTWTLGQVLGWQASFAFLAGDPTTVRQLASEGHRMAAESGDEFTLRYCGIWLSWAQLVNGDVVGATSRLREIEIDAQATQDALSWALATIFGGLALSYRGDIPAARLVLGAPMLVITDLGGLWLGNAHGVHAQAALAAGAVGDLESASAAAWEELQVNRFHQQMYLYLLAEAALAQNELHTARTQADDAVAQSRGWHRVLSLVTRARVAIAAGEFEKADRDVHEALALAVSLDVLLAVPDLLELLATLALGAGRHPDAARLLGAAEELRQRMGSVRFKSYDGDHDDVLARLREALGDTGFEEAWGAGAALSAEESIAYAQRGRGQRKRPSSGWGSLTPTERAVVELVSDGLSNKAIAAKLFISLRTVESHLTHIYTKVGLASRVQLVQEAARHARSGVVVDQKP